MSARIKFRINADWHIRILAKRFLALLVVVSMVLPLCPVMTDIVLADDGGVHMENTYMLSVSTGASAGINIMYFAVVYEDEKGVERREFIFPHYDALSKTYKIISSLNKSNERTKSLEEVFQYPASNYLQQRVLGNYVTNEFMFTPKYEMKKILSIEFFGKNSGSWTCTNFKLYKVNKLYGLEMAGFYSNTFYVDFDGELLAKMISTHTFNWSGNGKLFTELYGVPEYSVIKDIPEEERHYNTHTQQEIGFQLEFEDKYMAGIEAYATYEAIRPNNIDETLAAVIRYVDVHGTTQEVKLPVMISAMGWALERGVAKDAMLATFAGQGEKIAFSGKLPGFKKFSSITLEYGGQVQEVIGMSNGKGAPANLKEDDSVLIRSFSAMYVDNENPGTAEVIDGVLHSVLNTNGATLFVHSGQNAVNIRPGNQLVLKGENSYRKKTGDDYLVTIKTDDIDNAITKDDVYIKLSYTSLDDKEYTTDEYSLREIVKDYYGYWPGSENKDNGFESIYGTKAREICFMINLKEVSRFTGIHLTMGQGATDDWQFGEISIKKLSSLSTRKATWETISNSEVTVNRTFYRISEGTELLRLKRSILVQPGETKELSFSSQSTVAELDSKWLENPYSMTFEETQTNLGFNKKRSTYVVTVAVADDAVTDSKDGDCGSKNNFYFQLVFKNGQSGVVLANQQLSSDGFRPGYQETFTILTNQEYGDLVSVRIIPDDISQNSAIYDKLKIDEITVNKQAAEGLGQEWKVSSVGWIGIDYHEDGESTSLKGQQGRSMDEIARSFIIDQTYFTVNMEFCLSTEKAESITGQPFEGRIMGRLRYYDNSGEEKSKYFDVVEAIYQYNGKKAKYEEGKVAEDGTVSIVSGAVSDPKQMFSSNHMDRFIVNLSNVSSLISLELEMVSNVDMDYQFKTLTVNRILSSGELLLNSQGEYTYDYEVKELCEQNRETIPVQPLQKGTMQTIEMYFGVNEIVIDEVNHTWSSSITREPESNEDVLNVYVYTKPNADSITKYDLKASIQYTNRYGIGYQVALNSMSKNVANNMFYSLGVSANAFGTLDKILLAAQSDNAVFAYIDRVVIQQVRSGVVIDTFEVSFNGNNVDNGGITVAVNDNRVVNKQRQIVSLNIGTVLDEIALMEEKYDLALAIRYTTTNDMLDREYTSRYIYLTDQGYTNIRSKGIIDIEFNEAFVDEIIGLTLITSGGLTFEIDGVCAGLYNISDIQTNADGTVTVNKTCEKWYNFNYLLNVSGVGQILTPSELSQDIIIPIELELKTAEADSMVESGTDGPISLTVGYKDVLNQEKELFISDIHDYLVSGGFNTGEKAKIRFLLRNVSEVSWIRFEPRSINGERNASWKLESFKMNIGGTELARTVNRSVNKVIYEQDPFMLSVNNVVVSTDIVITNTETGTVVSQTAAINEVKKIVATPQQTVTITADVMGTTNVFDVEVKRVLANGAEEVLQDAVSVDGKVIKFIPPQNTTGSNVEYSICITPQTTKAVNATIMITVEPEGTQNEQPESNEEASSEQGTLPQEDATEDITTEQIPEVEETESLEAYQTSASNEMENLTTEFVHDSSEGEIES